MDFNKQLMHKKLEKDLISLAHDILKMKNRDDIFVLRDKSRAVFEKISMLAFVDEYVNTTPNLETTKEALTQTIQKAFETKETVDLKENNPDFHSQEEIEKEEKITENPINKGSNLNAEPSSEPPFEVLEDIIFDNSNDFKNDVRDVGEKKTPTLEDELQDTISVDIMADLFENAKPKSLNDTLVDSIQIGLNDRIAFVKNLFNGEQEDYNRVISQLNTYQTEKEARNFIEKIVKPDYQWEQHEVLEKRFWEIIGRKFA